MAFTRVTVRIAETEANGGGPARFDDHTTPGCSERQVAVHEGDAGRLRYELDGVETWPKSSEDRRSMTVYSALRSEKCNSMCINVAVSLRRDEPLYGPALLCPAHGLEPGVGTFGSALFVERETCKAPLGGAKGLLCSAETSLYTASVALSGPRPRTSRGTFGSALFVERENCKAPLGGARGLLCSREKSLAGPALFYLVGRHAPRIDTWWSALIAVCQDCKARLGGARRLL